MISGFQADFRISPGFLAAAWAWIDPSSTEQHDMSRGEREEDFDPTGSLREFAMHYSMQCLLLARSQEG